MRMSLFMSSGTAIATFNEPPDSEISNLFFHHLTEQWMKNVFLITLLMSAGAGTVFAHHETGGKPSGQAQAPAASQKTGKGTGLIQQIDREKGIVTITHGPLQGIKMPGMTMSYLIKDKAMLANLWSPQMVDFELTYDGKQYLITQIK